MNEMLASESRNPNVLMFYLNKFLSMGVIKLIFFLICLFAQIFCHYAHFQAIV